MTRHRGPEVLSPGAVSQALSRIPLDHYVVWDGQPCGVQAGSLRSRALSLLREPWKPEPLRGLVLEAARWSAEGGLDPDTVRNAIRMHQSARPAVYLLVKLGPLRDFTAVADIPWPASWPHPLRAGDLVLDRRGVKADPARSHLAC